MIEYDILVISIFIINTYVDKNLSPKINDEIRLETAFAVHISISNGFPS